MDLWVLCNFYFFCIFINCYICCSNNRGYHLVFSTSVQPACVGILLITYFPNSVCCTQFYPSMYMYIGTVHTQSSPFFVNWAFCNIILFWISSIATYFFLPLLWLRTLLLVSTYYLCSYNFISINDLTWYTMHSSLFVISDNWHNQMYNMAKVA